MSPTSLMKNRAALSSERSYQQKGIDIKEVDEDKEEEKEFDQFKRDLHEDEREEPMFANQDVRFANSSVSPTLSLISPDKTPTQSANFFDDTQSMNLKSIAETDEEGLIKKSKNELIDEK